MLVKIGLSLLTESVMRQVIGCALEQIKNHTETKIDDEILAPVIKALKGQ
jgi:hypothetical protein